MFVINLQIEATLYDETMMYLKTGEEEKEPRLCGGNGMSAIRVGEIPEKERSRGMHDGMSGLFLVISIIEG